MADKIKGAEYRLADVFSDRFVFTIPNYQRPYSWTTEQAEELLDDLLSYTINAKGIIDNLPPYFLGSIVLIKPEGKAESEVVDGQQRLTTLTVLLAVLRSQVPSEFSQSVDEYLFEKGNPIEGRPDRPRLTLRERDATYFLENVQKRVGLDKIEDSDTDTDPRRNVRDNALRLRDRIRALDEGVRVRLLQYLVQKCYLVVVSTPDLDSAYRIFSVLNDRGMDLSPTDILKADVIGKLSKNAETERDYTKRWEDIEEDLGLDRFRDLFGHIRTIHRKVKAKDTLLAEFRTYVKPADHPAEFIDDVLGPYSMAFVTVTNANYTAASRAEEVNRSLRWLAKIDNSDWVPSALAFLARYGKDPDLTADFFIGLDRLASAMFVYRANVNERLDRYARVLTAIESGEDLSASSSPLTLTADERSKTIRQLDGDLYLVRKIRLYVLLRLDAALSGGEAQYELPIVTVEHVLPQNPRAGSEWHRWYPTEADRSEWVHRIGNLVLLSQRKNSEARNYELAEKRKRYFTSDKGVSPFALTSQVIHESDWTPATLQRRQGQLVGHLKALWGLAPATTD